MQTITITKPDDWHLHLRDGAVLQHVIQDTATQFGRAIIMPNLTPPVTTTDLALAYRDRINTALLQHDVVHKFRPLMTLYLTNNTSAAEIKKAVESGVVHGVKLYPAGATTNSDAGVTDLLKYCTAALTEMQKLGLPLLVHGEVTDPEIDLFDREAVFIDRVMQPLRQAFPELKVVFEHLTTADGVAYVQQSGGAIAATITAHHLLYNRNALFKGGLRPHWYCLPVLKREKHRKSLLDAATSGDSKFFLGTDSAPHLRGAKEQDCGCAGCYTARHALALYATAFDSVNKIDQLESFASLNGPKFYGLDPNPETITLAKQDQQIESSINIDGSELVPLAAGEYLPWQLAQN